MDIFEASKTGNLEILKELLQIYVDKNIKNEFSYTALMLSSWRGHTECVQLLLGVGADTLTKNKYGETALMFSSWYGHFECVRLLLENGADTSVKNKYGHTALTLTKNKHIMRLLNRVSLGLLIGNNKNSFLNRDLIRHISTFL